MGASIRAIWNDNMMDMKLGLRDWFAGQALIALIAKDHNSEIGEGPSHRTRRLARLAYEYADIMMQEREVPAKGKRRRLPERAAWEIQGVE